MCLMKRILNKETVKYTNKRVKVSGWVSTVRSHGKIIFIDLLDWSGVLQLVFLPKNRDVYKMIKKIRPEWVIEVEGKIAKRPKQMENPNLETGKIELPAEKIKILSKGEAMPFSIGDDGYKIAEEKRMKYRYLDLRRERMRNNLIARQKIIRFMREFLFEEGFVEVETPILSKSTPEGARDFVVPSRLQPGKFYALPQAPQQYKQLLQISGIERYFQIARCFRDEDPRADRQAEFTQLDIEMSFVEQDDVMNLTEKLIINLVKELYPKKKIQKVPFPRLSYKEAMKKHKTDRPDLRKNKKDSNLLAFCWVVDFPFFEKDEKGSWTFTHNPFSAPKPEFMGNLMEQKNIKSILTTQYDIILNGVELGGGSIRNHQPEALESVFKIIGFKKEEIQQSFGHMLKAFKFGAPPHGGIAPGLDRFVMILQNESNIREVIAFPKTGDGRDLMMDAPAEVSKEQLRELKIKSAKTKK